MFRSNKPKIVNFRADYATTVDFCDIFISDTKHLYLLAFLLTANHQQSEQCFVSTVEEAFKGQAVFKEWVRSWLRCTLIENAIEIVSHASARNGRERDFWRAWQPGTQRECEIDTVTKLAPLERFVFAMSILERYSCLLYTSMMAVKGLPISTFAGQPKPASAPAPQKMCIRDRRDSAFVTYSEADGLPSDKNGPVYVDAKGRTWFAPLEGGLHWTKAGGTGSVRNAGLAGDVVYSISGREDELWLGRQRGGLTLLRNHGASITSKTYTRADGLAQNSVYAVYESNDGTVWAGTLNGGVSEFRNGRFTTYTTANGLSSVSYTHLDVYKRQH